VNFVDWVGREEIVLTPEVLQASLIVFTLESPRKLSWSKCDINWWASHVSELFAMLFQRWSISCLLKRPPVKERIAASKLLLVICYLVGFLLKVRKNCSSESLSLNVD